MSKTPSTSRPRKRMRVERAGAPGGLGYGRGWMALTVERHRYDGTGAWFPSWSEAMEFAAGEPLVSEPTA